MNDFNLYITDFEVHPHASGDFTVHPVYNKGLRPSLNTTKQLMDLVKHVLDKKRIIINERVYGQIEA